jgi:transposase
MAAAAPQQAGSVQTPPPAALGAGLHQRRRTVPGGHRPGLAGSYALVRGYVERHRVRPDPAPPTPPTVRQATGWLTRHPKTLTKDEQPLLKTVLERCAELRAAAGHVRAFGELLTRLRGQELPGWIADGLPGLSGFAAGLEHDIDAVACGLTTRWSSGPEEGRGESHQDAQTADVRPGRLPLLRKRILLTAAGGSRAGKRAR